MSLLACSFLLAPLAAALVGDIKVTVTREVDAAAIIGATVAVKCPGGAFTNLTGTTDADGVIQSINPVGSNCSNGKNVTVRAALDGYVEKTANNIGNYSILADPNSFSVTDVKFSQKVIASREADGAALTGATVTAGTNSTPCTEPGVPDGTYYCPVPFGEDGGSNDVVIALDGYVTNTSKDTSNRTSNSSNQGSANVNNVRFSHKVTVEREADNASVLDATVTAGSNSTPCIQPTTPDGKYYCPVPVAEDGGLDDVSVSLDGYVTNASESADRELGSDSQALESVTLQFAHAVEVSREADEALLTGATVSINGASCIEASTPNGIYYCLVGVDGDGVSDDVAVELDGYVSASATSPDRASGTEPQAVSGLALQFSHVVSVSDELGTALLGATVIAGDGFTACIDAGDGKYYCPVPASEDDASTASAGLDGYVSNESLPITDRADNAASQAIDGAALFFAHKVTVTREEDSAALTGATVTAGETGVECIEADEPDGSYYCPVLLAGDGGVDDATASKEGYEEGKGSTPDRDTGSSPQGETVLVLTLALFCGDLSCNGGENATNCADDCAKTMRLSMADLTLEATAGGDGSFDVSNVVIDEDVPGNVSAMIDFSGILDDSSGSVEVLVGSEGLSILKEADNHENEFEVFMPSGTVITGEDGWTGMFTLPTLKPKNSVDAPIVDGFETGVVKVIELGVSGDSLLFSQPVKITFPGQAGRRVGFSSGGPDLELISLECAGEDNSSNIVGDGECWTDSGKDLIVWTKHFTLYAAYYESEEGSSGGGGGGSGGSRFDNDVPPAFRNASSGTSDENNAIHAQGIEGSPECGDGNCNGVETCSSCASDCECPERSECLDEECSSFVSSATTGSEDGSSPSTALVTLAGMEVEAEALPVIAGVGLALLAIAHFALRARKPKKEAE